MTLVAPGGVRFASYGEFYAAVYADSIVERRTAGGFKATLLEARQGPGDWSDAAVPDLQVQMLLRRPARVSLDFGAGRFRGVAPVDQFIVAPPDTANRIVVEDEHLLWVVAVPWRALLAQVGEETGLPADGDFGRLHGGFFASRNVGDLTRNLWRQARAGRAANSLYCDGLLLQLAAELLVLRDGVALRTGAAGLPPWKLRRATDYLDAHLDEALSLADVAATAGLSPHHFARAFKASTGLPPHAWLTRRRVERARELLELTDRSVLEIALACGFSHGQHLARLFGQHLGMTPTEYRRQRRA